MASAHEEALVAEIYTFNGRRYTVNPETGRPEWIDPTPPPASPRLRRLAEIALPIIALAIALSVLDRVPPPWWFSGGVLWVSVIGAWFCFAVLPRLPRRR